MTSRDGKDRTPVGERTGSWDRWDPANLPENARRAALNALRELRGESSSTIDDNPGAGSRTRAAGPRAESTGFEVMTTSIDTIEEAAKSTKTAGRRLKNDLTRRNRVGKTPESHERRLRIRALKAAGKLETAAACLRRDINRLADPKA